MSALKTFERLTQPLRDSAVGVGLPFSYLYGAAMHLRNALYDWGRLGSEALSVPVISIGNLSMGGTGKTPLVDTLLTAFSEHKLGVLTRGYGRMHPEDPRLLWRAGGHDVPVDLAGDEPRLLGLKHPDVPIAIDGDRVAGGKRLLETVEVNGFLLDDGFQHRRLRRDLDIVILPEKQPLGNGLCLPAGRLREPVAALRRADMVLLAGDGTAFEEAREAIRPYLRDDTAVYGYTLRTGSLQTWEGFFGQPGKAAPSDGRLFAFAGIANPERFFQGFDGDRLAGQKAFPDHHRYVQRDLLALLKKGETAGADAFVTTEKDAVKLADIWPFDREPLLIAGTDVALTNPLGLDRDFLDRLRETLGAS